jgi:6-phosphofructokinase 1
MSSGAPPIPYDIEYTRDLGYGAVNYLKRVLKSGEPGGMITRQDGHMGALPFGSFTDPQTGRVRSGRRTSSRDSGKSGRWSLLRVPPLTSS